MVKEVPPHPNTPTKPPVLVTPNTQGGAQERRAGERKSEAEGRENPGRRFPLPELDTAAPLHRFLYKTLARRFLRLIAAMDGGDLASPHATAQTSPAARILQRLALIGVPQHVLSKSQIGLLNFTKANPHLIPSIVASVLPTDAQLSRSCRMKDPGGPKQILAESLLWLQWLMFESDPLAALESLSQQNAGRRGVCGAVWAQNDLAYHCRTCEQDPTCAICVPCFQNGDHKDHDYKIMYTGGGCCDCGDETAWKREGFCSMHSGTAEMLPLEGYLAESVGRVLDPLLVLWRDKVNAAAQLRNERDGKQIYEYVLMAASEMTSAVVKMLCKFCDCSGALLSFVSRRMFQCPELLDVLLRSESFLDKKFVRKMHELLLKLLGEPLFKYELGKVFVKYYPTILSGSVKGSSDSMVHEYPVLSSFSVQIFTVPALTLRLVREVNLLEVLMGGLADIFNSCVGEDGRIQAGKWANVYESTIRVVQDTRFVMSHSEVLKYIDDAQPHIKKTWICLLGFVQGMDAQKRITGLLTEEENENLRGPFMLTHCLGNVSNLLVEGAFSVEEPIKMKDIAHCGSDIYQGLDDGDTQRHAKVGKLSLESSVCSINKSGVSDCTLPYGEVNFDIESFPSVPSSVVGLILECVKAIESWLGPTITLSMNTSPHNASSSTDSNTVSKRNKLLRIRKGSNSFSSSRSSVSRMDIDELQEIPRTEYYDIFVSPFASSSTSTNTANVRSGSREIEIGTSNQNYTDVSGVLDDSLVELESGTEPESFTLSNLADWPNILYDVSSQEISFHLPLHRLLSLLLRKAMEVCSTETGNIDKANDISALPSSGHHNFLGKILGLQQPCGFSAFVMEHPLRLRVFCAQVRAGMWRRNGDAAMLSSEWYRAVQWSEQGLEPDLFLLQCCAALAPTELFVQRIQERFGLSSYTSLNLADNNEYESVMLQEMLILIIQIVQDRRFCGLSTTDNLRRELVKKLATGDATHSQLVKALPRDLSKSDQLQNVLDMLAVYSNPSGLKQGKYSLRKEQWRELDLYHTRWNSKDLQAAQDRYLRFCGASALNVQLPRWTGVFEPLKKISRIATSKTVFRIVHAVLFYALYTESSSTSRAPDGVLITTLHLLSLALDVCEKQDQICIDKVGADVGMSKLDDGSYGDLSHCAEDVFPILTCASELFDADVANNQSMLSLLVSLMKKHKEETHDNYAETRQCNISSSIENILKKFAQLSSVCLSNLERLAPDVACRMVPHSSKTNFPARGSDFEERRAKARERQAAILEKMKAEQSKFMASLKSLPSEEPDKSISKQEVSHQEANCSTEESTPVCSLCRDPDSQSPLCFLILLQKSRLTSFVERGPPSWEDVDQSHNDISPVRKDGRSNALHADSASPVHSAQDAALELPYNVELVEVDGFLDYFKERLPDIGSIELPNVLYDAGADTTLSLERMETDIYQSVKRVVQDTMSHSHPLGIEYKSSTSHMATGSKGSENVESSVLGEYVASLYRGTLRQHQRSMYDLLHIANVSPRSAAPSAKNGFGLGDCDGIHVSSCGHAMHQECHDRYLLSLKQRNIRRLGFEVGHIADPEMGELLCPVCRRFANSILPILAGYSDRVGRYHMSLTVSPTSYEVVSSDMDNNILHLPLASSLLQSTSKLVGQERFLKVLSQKPSETIEPALEPAVRKLCMLYYPNSYGKLSVSGRLSQSLILWDTLRYSLVATEIASRGKLKTGAGSSMSCKETLNGELHSSSGFIFSLLLGVAQSTRSLNSLEVLLRFRGIQLLTDSVCSGVSGDNHFLNSDKRKGTTSNLEHADNGESFPDIQFWKQASDPILVRDPFSSLMWVLFCLPRPFISSVEFYIPLVHLFYVVSVVQALIACYTKQYLDISSFVDSLLNDVCKTMGESELVRKYFVCNDIDSSCRPEEMIRRLTFPYLRRCALLWKLLQSLSCSPLYGNAHGWEEPNVSMNNDTMDCANYLTTELNGIRELEGMFQIGSLVTVLKDETAGALALKWCQHFCREFKARRSGGLLFSIPAHPFKLMQLPRVYQDLLQSFIKRQCYDCKSIPEEPALCLLCGRLCSPSWKPCCRPSRCQNHALACGAGIGVFLLVRKTTILLQRSSRQAVWPSPYLDAFGEEDVGMFRGKPLYLSDERYAALTYLVASHGLDRNSEVLRQTTIGFYGSD